MKREKFIIEIELINDAFREEPGAEIATILNDIADSVTHSGDYYNYRPIFDSNGNKCGCSYKMQLRKSKFNN